MASERVIGDRRGTCILCGSSDCDIVLGQDGKYRVVCHTKNCEANDRHCPPFGWPTVEIAVRPWGQPILQGKITVGEYIGSTGE